MKLGFVGFGAQAQENLAPCCMTLPDVELVGICDRTPARCEEALRLVPSARVFRDSVEMMDTLPLDALIVSCYPTEHFEIANHAIERGLPVFVEKPPAPSNMHLERMIEAAHRNNVTTGVGMNFRYAGVTRRLKALTDGQLTSATLRHFCNKPTQPFWDQTCLLKSFLYSQSIHSLDFLIDLFGPVEDVRTFGQIDDSRIVLTIVLSFAGGASASLITANTSPHFVFDFDVIALDGTHIASSALWSMNVSEKGKTYALGEQKRWSDTWQHSPLVSGFERSGYAGQMSEFFAAVGEGRESRISFASMRPVYNCMSIIADQMAENSRTLSRIAS